MDVQESHHSSKSRAEISSKGRSSQCAKPFATAICCRDRFPGSLDRVQDAWHPLGSGPWLCILTGTKSIQYP